MPRFQNSGVAIFFHAQGGEVASARLANVSARDYADFKFALGPREKCHAERLSLERRQTQRPADGSRRDARHTSCEQRQRAMPNLLELPSWDEQGRLRVVVETPRGSAFKVRYDAATQTFEYQRKLREPALPS